jgi:very-short-patch-repair endonuclease
MQSNPELFQDNLKKGYGCWKGKTKEKGYDWSHIKPDKKGKIKKCIICDGEFYVPPSQFRVVHCSKRCSAITKNIKQKTKNTDIELILKEWLIKNNIKFIEQKPIYNVTIPDFFIEPNICLYADGDYWHNLEDTKKRDKKINVYLKSNGYKIIRLKGSEIHQGKRPMELLNVK